MTVMLFFSMALLVGSFTHSQRSARVADRLRAALQGLSHKEVAACQDLDGGTWHKQLCADGVTPSLYRLANLPRETLVAFLKLWGADLGCTVLDSDDVRDVLLEHVYRREKRMAAMSLPRPHEKEQIA